MDDIQARLPKMRVKSRHCGDSVRYGQTMDGNAFSLEPFPYQPDSEERQHTGFVATCSLHTAQRRDHGLGAADLHAVDYMNYPHSFSTESRSENK